MQNKVVGARACPAGPGRMVIEFRTPRGSLQAGKWGAVALAGALALGAAGADPPPAWPPFLPARAGFAADVGAAVERVWTRATFSRTVEGRPVRAPLELYAALLDTPEITAAAARFRELSRDEVQVLGADWYEARDHRGAHGFYRVLQRDGARWVILSWGEHSGSLLGTIRGSALTVLMLERGEDEVHPSLTAYVLIENRVAAALARVLVLLFGGLADRRLRETFEVAAGVAEWAVAKPDDFCDWLLETPAAPARRARILGVLPPCEQRAGRVGPASG